MSSPCSNNRYFTVMNNISDGYGGGVYRSGTISRCIIVANEGNHGGGVKFSSGLIETPKLLIIKVWLVILEHLWRRVSI